MRAALLRAPHPAARRTHPSARRGAAAHSGAGRRAPGRGRCRNADVRADGSFPLSWHGARAAMHETPRAVEGCFRLVVDVRRSALYRCGSRWGYLRAPAHARGPSPRVRARCPANTGVASHSSATANGACARGHHHALRRPAARRRARLRLCGATAVVLCERFRREAGMSPLRAARRRRASCRRAGSTPGRRLPSQREVGGLQRRGRVPGGAHLRRRAAQGFRGRARSAPREVKLAELSERSERSERSEFRGGPEVRAAQGTRPAGPCKSRS